MDRQICFFGTTLQLRQESVQTPRFNTNNLVPSENLGVVHQDRRLESPWWDTITNHVVPFGELRLPLTKSAINKSDSVHEGTENLAVVCHKRLESPGRDTNHFDPFGELRLPLTCPRRNESDLVQDGLKGKEEPSIVTGTDVENHVSLDVEHIQPPSGCITTEYDDLSMDRRSDLVSSAENRQHPLDLEDIETPLSHTMMDNQSCLVDKPSEEHHESGLCNTDCLVPFEESRSQLTSHESIESEFVQEESERRDVALEENVEDHVSLIDCFTENQMKEHIASLNPSMSELGLEILRNKKEFIIVNLLPGCVKCKDAITTGTLAYVLGCDEQYYTCRNRKKR